MTKQFATFFQGRVDAWCQALKIVNSTSLNMHKVPTRRRYKQDRSKNVYQKVKMKTHIMQSHEAKITVTKLIMIHYSCVHSTRHCCFPYNLKISLSRKTLPNSINNQWVFHQLILISSVSYLHSFSLIHSSRLNRISSNSILAAAKAHLSISPLARAGK